MNERSHNEERLAEWTDRTLKQLPLQAAPATLAPRVLAQLARQKAVPWHRKPWMNWPRHFQILSVLLFAGLVGSIAGILLPNLNAMSLTGSAASQDWVKPVSTTLGVLGALGNAASAVLRNTQGWVIASLLGILASIYLSCLGLGTACWRIIANTR
jgi:hypothetical protein